MPRMRIVVAVMLLVSAGVPAQENSVADLSWMSGCWRQDAEGRLVDEMWMAPAGDAVIGMSRTVSQGRAVAHEFMQIRRDGPRLVFIARPSGQAEATFTLLKSGSREVTFENPAHDFPQRVIYRRKGEDTLIGRIEGTENGHARGIDFPMRRVACP
jgi:hypothetical protein